MTWFETHARIRIIRQVEAAAAVDMSGELPWHESWAAYFGDRDGLLVALRARWHRMCGAELDPHAGDKVLHETTYRLRRTHAGVLRILERHDAVPTEPAMLVRPVTPDLGPCLTSPGNHHTGQTSPALAWGGAGTSGVGHPAAVPRRTTQAQAWGDKISRIS